MKLGRLFCLTFGIIAVVCSGVLAADSIERETVGWVERSRLFPPDIILHAKLDTGASFSSLHAENITEFKRENHRWVQFTVFSRYGDRVVLERPVVAVKKQPTRRYFVRLGICVGNTYLESDVLLEDRREYQERLRLGRNFLAGNLVVDSSNMYTVEPECSPKSSMLPPASIAKDARVQDNQRTRDTSSQKKIKQETNRDMPGAKNSAKDAKDGRNSLAQGIDDLEPPKYEARSKKINDKNSPPNKSVEKARTPQNKVEE